MDRIDYDVALELASHEAIVRQAYKDSVGVWTWSIGLTNATGHNVERYIGKPASMKRCLEVYVWALEKYAAAVRKAFTGYKLTKAQFAAALSFHYNTGAISRATWVEHFKNGDMDAAEKGMKAYNKAGGRVASGLVARRKKEADLFFRGKWSNDGTILEYTGVSASYEPINPKRVNIERDLKEALFDAPIPTPKPVDSHPKPSPSPAPTGNAGKVAAGGVVMGILALLGMAWEKVSGWVQSLF